MLIFTEKESVAKKYATVLNLKKNAEKGIYEENGNPIKVAYAQGHLYELYEPEDYDENLKKWKYETLPIIPKTYKTKGIKTKEKKEIKKKLEENLRKAIQDHEEIAIATDPEREGEVIARFILDSLKADYERISRIWLSEGINDEEIKKAIKERKSASEYNTLYERGKAQKIADWVFGINLTRFFSIGEGELYSVGRVQSCVLKEIGKREIERNMFVPQKYYKIYVEEKNGERFELEREIKEKEQAESIKKMMEKGETILIQKIEEKEEKEKVPLLYDISEIMRDAFDIYDIAVEETEKILQKLYQEGLISYPRTDSKNLCEEDREKAERRIEEIQQKDKRFTGIEKELLGERKELFLIKKKEAHHGLLPIKFMEREESNEWKVYDLIERRLLMQGMKEYKERIKVVKGEIRGVEVILRGKEIVEKGWREAELKKRKEEKKIGSYREGEKREIQKIEIEENWTKKKERYTQSTIIKWMKNPTGRESEYPIGTQATRGSIIKTLYERGYIENKGKGIVVKEKGMRLLDRIRGNDLLDKSTESRATTEWEHLGEENPERFIQFIEELTKKILDEEKEKGMEIKFEKKIVCKCSCGGDIVKGKSSYYCTNYKEGCKNTIGERVYGKIIDENEVKRIFNKEKGKFERGINKDGKEVLYRIELNEEGKITFIYSDEDSIVGICPKCGENVLEYKKVFKCKNKECDFYMWKKTSGMEFMKEDIQKLLKGEKIKVTREKKDGEKEVVEVKIENNELKIKR